MDETLLDLEPEDYEADLDLGGLPLGEDGEEGIIDPSRDMDIDQNDVWEIISSFFRAKGLVHQQLDTFNHFLARIPNMASNLAEIIPRQDNQYQPGTTAEQQAPLATRPISSSVPPRPRSSPTSAASAI